MTIHSPWAIAAIFTVNIAVGAWLYLDVVRHGRSAAWLVAFWLCSVPAFVAYLVVRRTRASSAEGR